MKKKYSNLFDLFTCRCLICVLPFILPLFIFGQDGKLDSSFGEGGIVATGFPGNTTSDKGVKTLVLPDGKIIAAGYINNASFLYKISSEGIPDTNFGVKGISCVLSSLVVSDALLQDDGKIIITGTPNEDGFGDVKLARFNADGTLDKNFGIAGIATRLGSGYEREQPLMAIQPGGKIVVVKTASDYNNVLLGIYDHDFLLFRFNADGTLDNTFGNNGNVFTDFNRQDESNAKITILPDGKIILTGSTNTCQYGSCYDGILARYNVNGTLDESFSGDGKLILDFGDDIESICAAFLQENGALLLSGISGAYDSNDINFVLARINSDGSFDSTFDGDGILLSPFNYNYLTITSVVMQSDGKFVTGGSILDINDYTNDFVFFRFNNNGSLDITFNGAGIKILDMSGYDSWYENERFFSANLQPDNKILAIGYANDAVFNTDFALARINTDGNLDTDFNGTGKLYLSYGQSETYFSKAIVLPNGKILVVGKTRFGDNYNDYYMAVARFNTDGTPDTSFDNDGKEYIPFYDLISSSGTEISLQPDNKIIVAGITYNNVNFTEIAIAKLNPDGSLDETFDGDGKLTLALPSAVNESYSYSKMKILPDGKILVSGSIQFPSTNEQNVFVARLKSNGSLDETFNGTGIMTADLNTNPQVAWDYDNITDIILQSNGKILAVGNTTSLSGTDLDMVILRLNDNGSLDNTFDNDGIRILHFSDYWDQALTVALQDDGKIIVGGLSSGESAAYFALARLNSNGVLDTSFGVDGKQTTDMGPYWTDMINSIIIQADGKIIAAGYAEIINNGVGGGGIARYNTNGNIDTGFGDNGKVLSSYAGDAGFVSPVISGNKLYVFGATNEGIYKGLIERYVLTNDDVAVPLYATTMEQKIWPNPSKQQFTLKVGSNNNEPIELRVFDMYGKQVFSTKGSANKQYQFGGSLTSGIYMAEVSQGNHRSTIKLIKQ